MNKYAIYDKTTGKIARIECNNQQDMLRGLLPSEDYLEGEYSVNDVVDVETKTIKQYKMATIQDVRVGIRLPDDELNSIISRTEDVLFNNVTICQFRTKNYSLLRSMAYPKVEKSLDAQSKMTSPDVLLQAKGQAQLAKYYADCLAVKARFPKE